MIFITSLATRGIDVSYYEGAISQASFNCLYNNGYRFMVIEAQIGSTFSDSALSDYSRAKAAGFQYVDFYIFPTTKKDGRSQVRETIQRLQNNGVMNGNMIWLDVENLDLFYPTQAQNRQFITEMLDEMSNMLGANRVGVYTNWYQWEDIVGWDWAGASSHQLWYPHYDDWQSFDDFQEFGGWSEPNIKQYAGDESECSTTVDRNFY
ncbi:Glycosyl_hydrolase family 25 protein [Hexamita inflata]|uniref:Glycosyl hydrolase family 25 protein n=1 Tax=Hexamita inflata TaxID=28002 RepID=A0AA86PI97_9EUKA|nr:Glycosyl hydrolase family 25 protein [Hexamita inflata]